MNIELLGLGEYLGTRFGARVSSWGRDEEGNKAVGGHPQSWHLWRRGANAIDVAPTVDDNDAQKLKRRLEMIADEAKSKGYQAVIYPAHVHIEVPW